MARTHVVDQLVKSLPDSPVDALCQIVEKFRAIEWESRNEDETYNIADHEEFMEFYALAQVTAQRIHPFPGPDQVDLRCTKAISMLRIARYFEALSEYTDPILNDRILEENLIEFRRNFDAGFLYEFSDSDMERIQELLNELRQIIVDTLDFEEGHRRRLLKRLEKLQAELHKKMSDLDHFWGLVGDAGVAIHKFGQDAKPFVDRIKELSDIIWRAQSRAEGLPEGSKPPVLTDQRDHATGG